DGLPLVPPSESSDPEEQPTSRAAPAAEASNVLLRGPEGERGGEGYGTAVVLGELVRSSHEGGYEGSYEIGGPQARDHRTRATGRHHSSAPPAPRWTATALATGYPLTRHATHPTTAHAAEESPG
ncbi:hypothetical protein, partial [Streptomyces sp. T21Q-yed]|uniref:hypothetical protein n=1 Tax=Streptomyces sp. T21Q-yed TaxID=3018441 RepID=UPI0023DFA866